MHSLFEKASGITHDVIGAAIEVHKEKGLGLLESIYEWCLSKELELRRHRVDNQEQVIVQWKQILHPLFPQRPPVQSSLFCFATTIVFPPLGSSGRVSEELGVR